MQEIFVGTDIKFKIDIEGEGFDIQSDDFSIDLVRGSKEVVKTYGKDDLVQTDEGDYLLCVDASLLSVGTFSVVFRVHVPDEDFDDGIRTEVYREKLLTVRSV